MFKEKLLKEAVRLYAGQHVLDRVLQQGSSAFETTGVQRCMTVMWITPAMNKDRLAPLDPVEVARARIAYWSSAIRTIEQDDGTVDGFFADDLLAYFGDRDGVNHAALAMSCATRIVKATRSLDAPATTFQPRIGMDTGIVYLGNIGTPERVKFTVMSDAINLASRLALRVGEYSTQTLLTHETFESAGSAAGVSASWVRDVDVV